MGLSPVCIKNLLLSIGKENRCRCANCQLEKEREEAIEFYRKDVLPVEEFPEKTGRINEET